MEPNEHSTASAECPGKRKETCKTKEQVLQDVSGRGTKMIKQASKREREKRNYSMWVDRRIMGKFRRTVWAKENGFILGNSAVMDRHESAQMDRAADRWAAVMHHFFCAIGVSAGLIG